MRLEVVKTYVLIALVGLSLLLTFSLWSYKSNNEVLYNNQSKYVNEGDFDLGGKEVAKKEIIAPSLIIFHNDGTHYGFEHPLNCQNLYKDMQSWVLYDFIVTDETVYPKNDHQVKIVFPDELPISIVSSIFSLDDDVDFPSWSFQRLFITFDENKKVMYLHFISVDGRQKARAEVNNGAKYDLLWSYMTDRNGLVEYTAAREDTLNPIYIPEKSMKIPRRSLAFNSTDLNMLKNALFSNPSLVSRNLTNENVVYYTDGQRQMRVFQDRRSMEFINPYQSAYDRMDAVDLLNRSILNINEYKGWTNDYKLETLNPSSNTIRYQLYYEGYPIYNSDLTMIVQQWRNQELFQYKRPLFILDNSFGGDEVEMPSGKDVLYFLKNASAYKLSQIEDIRIGYKLYFHDTAVNTLTLEPEWFIKYNGDWLELNLEDMTHSAKGVS